MSATQWLGLFLYAAAQDGLVEGRAGNPFKRSDGLRLARYKSELHRFSRWLVENDPTWPSVDNSEEDPDDEQ